MTERRSLPHYLVSDLAGTEVKLDGEEGHHARTVRRVRSGEQVCLTDGNGRWLVGEVIEPEGRSALRIRPLHRGVDEAPQPEVTVVQALVKGDRGPLVVELLTETGVDRIVPWQAQRSIARWREEKAERGVQRWQRVANEAAKQSRRVRLPQVQPLVDSTELNAVCADADTVLICHESATRSITEVDLSSCQRVVIVVGPEGGISDDELTALTQAGGQSVTLGPTVLRASTAGAVAATWVLASAGRWDLDPQQGSHPDTTGDSAP
jgi:16S rRNA (uracil1498-N3)-methyltransferase